MLFDCPYCREAIVEADALVCSGCHTPHYKDCWIENGGCTVFGCSSAPLDEPKIATSEVLPPSLSLGTSQFSIFPTLHHSRAKTCETWKPIMFARDYVVSDCCLKT